MGLPLRFSKLSGWQKAAVLNTAVMLVLTVILSAFLAASSVRSGGINKTLIFFHGACEQSRRLNLGLHLLLNVASTLILASSNFFMQILSSPSRPEVDAAHARFRWLDIGIPSSLRNLVAIRWFKSLSWLLFLLSSVPVHLFFNSAVFETDSVGSGFYLSIAAESLLQGAEYFAPGVSLYKPGGTGLLEIGHERYDPTWALDADSAHSRNLSKAATKATTWERLDVQACRAEYYCGGLRRHRDLVMVVHTTGAPQTAIDGWARSDLFHVAETDGSDLWNSGEMPRNEAIYWDDYMPRDAKNSLWHSEWCNMSKDLGTGIYGCSNTCSDQLSIYPFNSTYWTMQWPGPSVNVRHGWGVSAINSSQLLNFELDVQYCLAEPVQRYCKVGLSNVLLLVVTLCVALKTSQCLAVVVALARDEDQPLVTLGDAIESFLCQPDKASAGMCTVGWRDIEKAQTDPVYTKFRHEQHPRFMPIAGAARWGNRAKKYGGAIPPKVWALTYLLILFVLGSVGVLLHCALVSDDRWKRAEFGQSGLNNVFHGRWFPLGQFLPSVLLANTPQLVLSICYLAYNSLFTRLLMAREWALMSTSYRSLRVTNPKGDQISTYRLQLPYKCSIPLLVTSALLHWLVSNTFYIFISEGSYYTYGYYASSVHSDTTLGISDDNFIGIGYSVKAIIVVLAASIVLVIIPMPLAFLRLPGNMTIVGSNSLATSAACHASTLSKARNHTLSKGNSENSVGATTDEPMLVVSDSPLAEVASEWNGEDKRMGYENRVLTKLSQSKLKWGVVQMPPGFYEEFVDLNKPVGHLSFDVEEGNVQEPVDDYFYA